VKFAAVENARGPSGHPRFAVRPYPKEWERRTTLRDGTPVFVRPIRPEDERLYATFFAAMTDEDLRLRFFPRLRIAATHSWPG
jgi:acetyltransferase